MTAKDQELLAEAYMTEVFGFGSKPEIIDIKKQTDPESFSIVLSVLRTNPQVKQYIQSCTSNSCLIDKKQIPRICSVLKKQYESMDNDEFADRIIDAHDILSQISDPSSYEGRSQSQPWGYEPQ